MSSKVNVKEIISELRDIRDEHPNKIPRNLTGRVETLLRALKRAGYSDQQIYDFVGGGWSLPTIRQYTKGVKVGEEIGTKNETAQLLREFMESDLRTEDIKEALEMKKKCDSFNLPIDKIAQFLNDCAGSSIGPASALAMLSELKGKKISIDTFAEVAEYKSQLDKLHYDIDTLRKFKELALKFSEKDVFEALAAYGKIQNIQAEMESASAKRGAMSKEVQSIAATLEIIKKEKATLQRALDIREHLNSLGITDNLLEKVAKMAARYNGVENFFEALDKFENIASLESELSKLDRKCQDAESKRLLLEAKHANLVNAIAMCDSLITKFKFSIETIEKLHEIAKSYGEPSDVYKAVATFGEFASLRRAVEELENTKIRLVSEIAELEKQRAGMQGQVNVLRNAIVAMPEEVEKQVKAVHERIMSDSAAHFSEFLAKVIQYAEEHSRRVGEIQAYEPMIQFSRVFMAVMTMPDPKIENAQYFAKCFLAAAKRVCIGNNLNSLIELGQVFGRKYPSLHYFKIEIADLIDMAFFGLNGSSPNGSNRMVVA